MNHGKDGIVLRSPSVVEWDQGAPASCLCAPLAWEAEERVPRASEHATPLGAIDIPSQLEPNRPTCAAVPYANLELASVSGTRLIVMSYLGPIKSAFAQEGIMWPKIDDCHGFVFKVFLFVSF